MVENKKSWFRRHWVLTIILGFTLLIIGIGVLFGDNSSNSYSNSESTLSSDNSGNCPKELVPDRIKIDCSDYEKCKNNQNVSGVWCSCEYIETEDYKWTDGTEMHKANNINFRKATESGENMNYLYSWSYVIYDKTPINPDRTIGKQIFYAMFLAIDPSNKTTEGYRIVSYKCTQAYSEWVTI